LKRQVGNVIKSLSEQYRFHSLSGYRALLSLYNVGVEKVEGDNKGHRYTGLVYSALDPDGNRVGQPLKSSLFGKKYGIGELERAMTKSGEEVKTKGLRTTVAALLADSVTGGEFRTMLRDKGIDLVLRYGNGGRLFGATFIDHNTRTVLNGSTLGKDFAANALAERFPDLATESRENRRPVLSPKPAPDTTEAVRPVEQPAPAREAVQSSAPSPVGNVQTAPALIMSDTSRPAMSPASLSGESGSVARTAIPDLPPAGYKRDTPVSTGAPPRPIVQCETGGETLHTVSPAAYAPSEDTPGASVGEPSYFAGQTAPAWSGPAVGSATDDQPMNHGHGKGTPSGGGLLSLLTPVPGPSDNGPSAPKPKKKKRRYGQQH
jgi:hypothetical protein